MNHAVANNPQCQRRPEGDRYLDRIQFPRLERVSHRVGGTGTLGAVSHGITWQVSHGMIALNIPDALFSRFKAS